MSVLNLVGNSCFSFTSLIRIAHYIPMVAASANGSCLGSGFDMLITIPLYALFGLGIFFENRVDYPTQNILVRSVKEIENLLISKHYYD